MAATRNTNVSEFRLVLNKLKDLQEKLEKSDQSAVANQLTDINDSLRINEGNQSDFSDAVFQTLAGIQATMERGFKAMDERVAALESKIAGCDSSLAEGSSSDAGTPPSSSRKRKIPRHPDLSHYIRSKMDQLGLLWNTEKKENEPPNQTVVTTILKEVKEIDQIKNDSLCTERRILDAISQNYCSNKKRRRQLDNGTYEQYQKEQKRRQRIKRKLEKRLKGVSEEEKNGRLYESLHPSLMSSDESDQEEETLLNRPLRWRAEEVSNFFQMLDIRYRTSMSSQQRRQCANRRVGPPSRRGSSDVPEKLHWAVTS
ncbi:uncharacterized protein [Montipora foliosa]|uniref:uncharacterized protein n=1 Tax=Montipora foliosa TaxID=591990 RepID=UPI0035F211AB